jgi:hypothetical protein
MAAYRPQKRPALRAGARVLAIESLPYEIANAPIDFPPTRRRTHLEIANLGLTSPRLMSLPIHLTIWKMRRFAALIPF